MRSKPMLAVAVKIHSDNEGVKASQARAELGFAFEPLSGAILDAEHTLNVAVTSGNLRVVKRKKTARPIDRR